jgi:hypothetical protein
MVDTVLQTSGVELPPTFPPDVAAQIDHRFHDDAAHPADRAACYLSGALLIQLDLEQVDGVAGFGNFTFLFKRETFWMVVRRTIFAVTVIFSADWVHRRAFRQ